MNTTPESYFVVSKMFITHPLALKVIPQLHYIKDNFESVINEMN